MDFSQITNQINQAWAASQNPQPAPGTNPWGTVSQADGNGREKQAGSMQALTWDPVTGDGWGPGGQMTPGKNPYAGALGQANSSYLSQAPGIQQNMSQLQGQINKGQQGQSGSGYPAYTNSYGLGSTPQPPAGAGGQDQSAVSQGMASNPDYLKDALTASAQSVASRGFNPWSLTGESNARGK